MTVLAMYSDSEGNKIEISYRRDKSRLKIFENGRKLEEYSVGPEGVIRPYHADFSAEEMSYIVALAETLQREEATTESVLSRFENLYQSLLYDFHRKVDEEDIV